MDYFEAITKIETLYFHRMSHIVDFEDIYLWCLIIFFHCYTMGNHIVYNFIYKRSSI